MGYTKVGSKPPRPRIATGLQFVSKPRIFGPLIATRVQKKMVQNHELLDPWSLPGYTKFGSKPRVIRPPIASGVHKNWFKITSRGWGSGGVNYWHSQKGVRKCTVGGVLIRLEHLWDFLTHFDPTRLKAKIFTSHVWSFSWSTFANLKPLLQLYADSGSIWQFPFWTIGFW